MIRIPAPDFKNKAWTIAAEVTIPQDGANGVLATMGGRYGGWALLMQDGKPEFAYAYSNQPEHKYRVVSDQALTPGNHILRVKFEYAGGGIGKAAAATLLVDEKQVGQGQIPQTIGVRFSLDETFDVGEDTGTPVLEEYEAKMPFRFNQRLRVKLLDFDQHSGFASVYPSAAMYLVGALASLRDHDMNIKIDGFYDKVVQPTENDRRMMASIDPEIEKRRKLVGFERLVRDPKPDQVIEQMLFLPTCNIAGITTGYQGPGSKTVLPAVANAIFNAVGVRIDDLPITPEKVLRAIKAQGGARPQARR